MINPSTEGLSAANILVVDDTPANLRLLVNILSNAGYTVRAAKNGRTALSSAQTTPPDLILLDIMMPGLDGYEVCRQLKDNARTKDIPVIFISALDAVEDKVQSFTVGGVDYVSKPFQAQEVLARVKTHLTIRYLQQSLLEQIKELEAFSHTVAHDIKNPISTISGFAELVAEEIAPLNMPKAIKYLDTIRESSHRSINIIEELLMLARLRKEEVPLAPINMGFIVQRAQHRLDYVVETSQAIIVGPDQWPPVLGYPTWVEEIWVNYLSNGIKYGGRPPLLEVGYTPQADGYIRFWVKDNGPGIIEADQENLFTEFTRLAHVRAKGHGLGLSIVKRIATKLGGQVGVESNVGQGSLFYFTLSPAEENRGN